jgi:signal transduction histidine kinase
MCAMNKYMNKKVYILGRFNNLKLGLRDKIIVIMDLFILIMALNLVVFFIYQQKELAINHTEKWAASLATNLAYDSEYGVLLKDKFMLTVLIDNLFKEKKVASVTILDNQWGEILCYRKVGAPKLTIINQMQESDRELLKQKGYLTAVKGDIIEVVVPVKTYEGKKLDGVWLQDEVDDEVYENNGHLIDTIGYVKMAISMKDTMIDLTHTRNLSIIIIGLISIIYGFLLSRFLNVYVINPIRTFAKGAEDISAGDYDQQINISTTDEIGQLAKAFNKMAINIKKSHKEIKNKADELEKANLNLKETQAQLIQAGKLSAIGQLAAGVAHELNNPLGVIMGFAQYLIRKISGKRLDETTAEDMTFYVKRLTQMEQASKRCKTIVENLLKFSRVSKDQLKPLNLNHVLKETLLFTKHQLEISKVQVKLELASNLPLVNGNNHQLQQVFTNIIINAQQATAEGGTLLLKSFAQNGYVEMQFTDTGCGIEPEHIGKVFDPFFTTKEVGHGTGLGLSVSYGIIRNLGGEIIVKSVLGQGSTFSIRLPSVAKN